MLVKHLFCGAKSLEWIRSLMKAEGFALTDEKRKAFIVVLFFCPPLLLYCPCFLEWTSNGCPLNHLFWSCLSAGLKMLLLHRLHSTAHWSEPCGAYASCGFEETPPMGVHIVDSSNFLLPRCDWWSSEKTHHRAKSWGHLRGCWSGHPYNIHVIWYPVLITFSGPCTLFIKRCPFSTFVLYPLFCSVVLTSSYFFCFCLHPFTLAHFVGYRHLLYESWRKSWFFFFMYK